MASASPTSVTKEILRQQLLLEAEMLQFTEAKNRVIARKRKIAQLRKLITPPEN